VSLSHFNVQIASVWPAFRSQSSKYIYTLAWF